MIKKKMYIYVFITFIILFIVSLFFIKKCMFFDGEKLKGEYVIDTHISIVGDYMFYESKSGVLGMAKNLKTGENKIVGIGLYNVNVYDDEIYYFAQRSPNPESYFCRRGVTSLIENRVMPNRVSQYKFYNDYLYFQKHSYSTDVDGSENGYLYRMNLDTKQTDELIGVRTRGFDIANNNLYYIRYSEEGYEKYRELLCDGIFGYSLTDNTEFSVIDGFIGDFDIYENDIVYSEYKHNNSANKQKGKYHLLWLNLETNKKTEITNDVMYFKLYNEKLCFVENDNPDEINIFNCSNGNIISVAVRGIDNSSGFVLHENKIYYYDQNHNLCDSEL